MFIDAKYAKNEIPIIKLISETVFKELAILPQEDCKSGGVDG